MKDKYPDSKSDLFAAFIERAIEMLTPLGYMAQVTMQSWMFLSSYEKLRRLLGQKASIESLLHMDNMVMRIAFGTCATIWKIGGSSSQLGTFTYVEMGDLGEDYVPTQFPADNSRTRTAGDTYRFSLNSEDFAVIPGSPIVYWLSEKMRGSFTSGDALGAVASLAVGLQTGDNNRFLRRWWEVSDFRTSFTCTMMKI